MSVPNINFNSSELYSNTGMEATHKTSLNACDVLLLSFLRTEPHCRHGSTRFLTTQSDQSKRHILIDYILKHFNIVSTFAILREGLRVSLLSILILFNFKVSTEMDDITGEGWTWSPITAPQSTSSPMAKIGRSLLIFSLWL